MKNQLDKQYIDLLQDILDNGTVKKDRTGTGTISVFGRQIRHKMSEGFPLLTTKKMAWKSIVVELLWFLRGDTNIKYLLENDCHIWDGDAYQAYLKKDNKGKTSLLDYNIKFDGDTKTTSLYTKEEFINKIKTDDEFAKKWGNLGNVYGKQWRDWGGYLSNDKEYFTPESGEKKITLTRRKYENGIDQIQNIITKLKTNPDDRRMLVTAWNPDEVDTCVLPPCHYGFQVYTRELSLKERRDWCKTNNVNLVHFEAGLENEEDDMRASRVPTRAISLMWNQRSVDTFLGLPFNIASYGLLLEILAKITNMVPDELIGNLGDTHLYLNHVEQAKEQIGREPYPLPKLNINTEFWLTESGECGVGPLSATSILDSLQNNNFCKCLIEEDIQLSNYQSHPTIKAPLSN
jgi:thymidylate synthase